MCHENVGRCPGRGSTEEYEEAVETNKHPQLEELVHKLFQLQDLRGDGLLEEEELMKLNEKIAMAHHGKNADLEAVRKKYCMLFRSHLDADGRAVPYSKFRTYMRGVLDELDADAVSQQMILEQFIAEAQVARRLFYQMSFASDTDWPFMPRLSQGSWDALDAQTTTQMQQIFPIAESHSCAFGDKLSETPKGPTKAISGRSEVVAESKDQDLGAAASTAAPTLLETEARRRSCTTDASSRVYNEADSILRSRSLTASGMSPRQPETKIVETRSSGSVAEYTLLRSWTSISDD